MRTSYRALTWILLVSVLAVGCGPDEPTAAPVSQATVPTETTLLPTALPPYTDTPLPVTKAPSPTPTDTPPRATPSPAPTDVPPTDTPTPTGEPPPEQPSVAEILAELQGLPFSEFTEESYRQLQLRDPDTLIYNGLAEDYGVEGNARSTDLSDAYIRETQQLEAAVLDMLRGCDRGALTPEDQLSYDIYEWYLDDLVRAHEFMYNSYIINGLGLWDMQNWLMDFLVHSQTIGSQQDAEEYVERLSQLDTWTEQLLEGLKLREQAGVIPPRFLLVRSVQQLEEHLMMRTAGSFSPERVELYTAFRDSLGKVQELSAGDRETLLDVALAEIEDTFIPAFDELRKYLVRLDTLTTNQSGVWKFSNGEAYYAYILRHHTSTDLTAPDVHELGLVEVARIQGKMQMAAAELGYPPDIGMAELDQLISTESDLLQGTALQAEYERLIAEADRVAPAFFDLYPGTPPVVEYDPTAPIGCYEPPPLDGTGPGRMPTNLQNPSTYTLYNVPVLLHHETIPGHHVQTAVAQELGVPKLRRDHIFDVYRQHLPFQAYVEGWALYAEQLAWEMGLYEGDPLGNLGRLRLQLHRTARMVVDTGIHAMGWTAGEATDYMEQATGAPYSRERLAQIIAIPGQACSYNLGRVVILELRQRAMDELGDRFDIKEFHNVVLSHGAMPLEILEQVVEDWIEAELRH
jgi:uncharacterized protein (DUF885 family)